MLLQADASEEGHIGAALSACATSFFVSLLILSSLYCAIEFVAFALILAPIMSLTGGLMMYRVVVLRLGSRTRLARLLVMMMFMLQVATGPVVGAMCRSWGVPLAALVPMGIISSAAMFFTALFGLVSLKTHRALPLIDKCINIFRDEDSAQDAGPAMITSKAIVYLTGASFAFGVTGGVCVVFFCGITGEVFGYVRGGDVCECLHWGCLGIGREKDGLRSTPIWYL
eukprot:PhM_4_TR1486/c0_g1_i1/m.56180